MGWHWKRGCSRCKDIVGQLHGFRAGKRRSISGTQMTAGEGTGGSGERA